MRAVRPLLEHQELVILDTPNLCREYRIESWRPTRNRKKVVRGAFGVSTRDACVVLFLALLWPLVRGTALEDQTGADLHLGDSACILSGHVSYWLTTVCSFAMYAGIARSV